MSASAPTATPPAQGAQPMPDAFTGRTGKCVMAFDSYKGCLSAHEACQAARSGWLATHPGWDVVCLPMSDGGEGMTLCMAHALGLPLVSVGVHGPLMQPVTAHYAIAEATDGHDVRTAYMEMAEASGLTLVPAGQRDPMRATTYGVGEMIIDAVSRGCKRIVMGIGGSATCDGGQGMVEALQGHLPLHGVSIVAASDVSNPLFGPEGAAYVFAPQKGATPQQVEQLDQRLRLWARHTERLGMASPSLAHHPGAGAAGGLGYALMAYLHAQMMPGIDLMLDATHFDRHIADADLIITGEGKSDHQTLMGKVPMGVLRRAQPHGTPVVLLSGAIDDRDVLLDAGFADARSINADDQRPLSILIQKDIALNNLFTSCSTLTATTWPAPTPRCSTPLSETTLCKPPVTAKTTSADVPNP